MSLRLERIAEEKIKQAMEEGLFNNLPGMGKPIDWKENPFAPEDWKMAFDILKQNGYKLPWMDKREEIDRLFIKAIQDCQQNLKYQPAMARATFFKQVEAINRIIFDYNLMVPASQFQIRNFDSRAEFLKLKKTISG